FLIKDAQDARERGDLKTAENLYKQSIAAADKLDMTQIKAAGADAAQRAKDLNAKGDMVHANMALEEQKQYELYQKLPWLIRQEMAEFYNKVGKGDEAKTLLD